MLRQDIKALELVEKYYKLTATDNRSYVFNDAIVLHKTRKQLKAIIKAKECALLAVDEILNLNPKIGLTWELYYYEVRKCIEEI